MWEKVLQLNYFIMLTLLILSTICFYVKIRNPQVYYTLFLEISGFSNILIYSDFSKKKVLVYGLGDIGKNTCKNLIEYAKIENITLINRTLQKAEEFVQEHPLVKINSTDNLAEEIANSDWTSCCKGPILKKELEEKISKFLK